MDYTQNTKANLPHLNQSYSSVWDNHPIIGQIGGWVCDKDTGDLKYKLNKTDWNKKADGSASVLTGEDGDVMVKIPAFYIKCSINSNGKPRYELDDVIPDENQSNARPGFHVLPCFLDSNGKVKPYILIAAYEGIVIDGQLRSVSGAIPTASKNISWFTDSARQGRNTGINHHDIGRAYERMATNLLMYFEFGTLNIQDVLGKGISELTDDQVRENPELQITGQSNGLGDRSGYLVADDGRTNGKAAIRWRGIENYYGNFWEFTTGLMISDAGYHHTNDPTKFLNMNAMELHSKDLSVKMNNGYIKQMEVIPGKEWLMIPSETGGSSSTYWCDYVWTHNAGQNNISLAGGRWSRGAACGPACWVFYRVASNASWAIVARLSCSKK